MVMQIILIIVILNLNTFRQSGLASSSVLWFVNVTISIVIIIFLAYSISHSLHNPKQN